MEVRATELADMLERAAVEAGQEGAAQAVDHRVLDRLAALINTELLPRDRLGTIHHFIRMQRMAGVRTVVFAAEEFNEACERLLRRVVNENGLMGQDLAGELSLVLREELVDIRPFTENEADLCSVCNGDEHDGYREAIERHDLAARSGR